MHSPDCRNFTGPAYSASTQCKPPLARQQNVIRMTFSWRADVRGGGGALIFSHIRRLRLFLRVKNSEFQYFLGFQKNENCLGYEDYVAFFLGGGGGHHKNGLV